MHILSIATDTNGRRGRHHDDHSHDSREPYDHNRDGVYRGRTDDNKACRIPAPHNNRLHQRPATMPGL